MLRERRIAEALRITEKERTRRDVENAKLKARIEKLEKNNTKENAELRDHITKVEQRQMLNDTSSNNSSSNFNSVANQISKANLHHESTTNTTMAPLNFRSK